MILYNNFSKTKKLLKKPWMPRLAGRFDNHMVRVTYFKGSFKKHYHTTDELFVVIQGTINMGIPGKEIILAPGDSFVVKKKQVHEPSSKRGAYVMTIEVEGTKPIFTK